MAVLSLTKGDRTWPSTPGLLNRAKYVPRLREPLHQLEFVIDGRHLRQVLETIDVPNPETYGFQAGLDMKSVADLAWPGDAAAALRRLAGLEEPSLAFPLGSSRLPIYVCPMCADLACGAVTVQVLWDDDAGTVTWRDIRLEDGYTVEGLLDLSAMPEYVFDAAPYRATLLEAIASLEALLEDEQAARSEWRGRGLRRVIRRAPRE